MQQTPVLAVVEWLDRQPSESVWTTSITVFEIEFGLQRLPAGKPRSALDVAFRALITEDLGGRILDFNTEAALAAGAISAAREAEGRTVEIRDVEIAGIARARQAVVATRNVKHFENSCRVVNPWVDQ